MCSVHKKCTKVSCALNSYSAKMCSGGVSCVVNHGLYLSTGEQSAVHYIPVQYTFHYIPVQYTFMFFHWIESRDSVSPVCEIFLSGIEVNKNLFRSTNGASENFKVKTLNFYIKMFSRLQQSLAIFYAIWGSFSAVYTLSYTIVYAHMLILILLGWQCTHSYILPSWMCIHLQKAVCLWLT